MRASTLRVSSGFHITHFDGAWNMLGQTHPEIPIQGHHLARQIVPLPIDRNRWAAPQSSEAADWTAGWGQTARKSYHNHCRIR